MAERNAGRDLDALIAERVYGFRWFVSSATGRRAFFHPDARPEWFNGTSAATGDEARCVDWDARVRRYSTDTIAALDALSHVGGIVTITRMASDDWRVTLGSAPWVNVWAETLPLAICRALEEVTRPAGGVPAGDASDPEERET